MLNKYVAIKKGFRKLNTYITTFLTLAEFLFWTCAIDLSRSRLESELYN